MTCLSIQDLALFTGGQLQLGVLPPLGGVMEPIRRIRTDLEHLQAGDIYWQLDQSAEVHAAFACGAKGIVYQGSQIEPWAGRFSLQVRSAQLALQLAATRSRRLYNGCLIGIHEIGCQQNVCEPAHQFLTQLRMCTSLGCDCQPADENEMALEIIHLDERRPITVFNPYRQSAAAKQCCWQRFGANVIVTTHAAADQLSGLDAKLIYCDDYQTPSGLAQAAFEAGESIVHESITHKEPCVALPSLSGLRESDVPTLLGRSNKLADRWLLGRSPWRVLPGRA